MSNVISFDYDSILQRLRENFKSKSEWADFLSYSVIDNLISPIAQELAYAMQYNEYLTYENWWSLARNKSSLLVQSSLLGYSVPRKKGASGTLRVSTSKTFNDSYGKDIYIPKFSQFSGNGTYVACVDDYILNGSENYRDIVVKQGEVKKVTFLALGDIYEEKTIEDGNIDNDFFQLTVEGQIWTKVDTLFDYGSDDMVYELYTKPDLNGVIIKFGNNVFGKKLSQNDQVVFTYLATDGSDGNLYLTNSINKVESTLYTVTTDSAETSKAVKTYCTNITTMSGGEDYPTIDEIRTLAPKLYQTGDRASSIEDYEAKILSYTDLNITKVNVWGAFEILKDENKSLWTYVPIEDNVIHIACLNGDYDNLNDVEKSTLSEYLHLKSDPTDIIQYSEVEKIPLIFNIDGELTNSSYTIEGVRTSILNTLENNYDISKMNFDENIYNSDYVRLIDEVNGIRHHTSYIQALKKDVKFTTQYAGSFILPLYPIDLTSVTIYIQGGEFEEYTPIAYSTSDGLLLGYEDFATSGSSINSATGWGVLIVQEGLISDYTDYTLKIIYKCSNQDLILNNRYNIFDYDSANITLSYSN